MLQQTRVQAVLPYFERFMSAAPDVPALAELAEDRLLSLWQGLGYYSRARSLQRSARVMVDQYGGCLPDTYSDLIQLPESATIRRARYSPSPLIKPFLPLTATYCVSRHG